MIKRIWDFLADLRWTFGLLLGVAALLWIGSMYALADYPLFDSMNGVRVQDWFLGKGLAHPGKSWWVPALFTLFAMLGANTAACTARRVVTLWEKRKNFSALGFAVALAPSLVHILFFLMLAGHLLTFTGAVQVRFPVSMGSSFALPGGTEVRVGEVTHTYFPEDSLLRDRIRQSSVALEYDEGGARRKALLEFLEPVDVRGYRLHLDMEKKKFKDPGTKDKQDESCNKERHYHVQPKQAEPPRLYVMATRDPGLALLVPCFFLVIGFMGFYFLMVNRVKAGNGDL